MNDSPPPSRPRARHLLRGGIATACVGVVLLAAASPALAATVSQSSAQAVKINLLGGTVTLASPLTTATNSGGPTDTEQNNSALAVLPAQSVLKAGALSTSATAQNNGLSFACAGVVQPGGAVSVGADGSSCTSTGTGPGGVTLDLGQLAGATLPVGIGQVLLQLNAVVAYAASQAGSPATGGAKITGGKLSVCDGALVAGNCVGQVVVIPLTIAGGVNKDLLSVITTALTNSASLGALGAQISAVLSPALTIRTNVQTTNPQTGVFSVTAIQARVITGALGSVDLAVATAGPNALPTPIVSGVGWPIGITLLILIFAAFWTWRHRTTRPALTAVGV